MSTSRHFALHPLRQHAPLLIALSLVAVIGIGMVHYLSDEDRSESATASPEDRSATLSAVSSRRMLPPTPPQVDTGSVNTNNALPPLTTEPDAPAPQPLAADTDNRPVSHLQYDLRSPSASLPGSMPYTRLSDPTETHNSWDLLGTLGNGSDMKMPSLSTTLVTPDDSSRLGESPVDKSATLPTTSETIPTDGDPFQRDGTTDATTSGSLPPP